MSHSPSGPTKADRKQAAREARIAKEQAEAASATRRRRFLQLGGVLAAAVVVLVVAIVISSGGGSEKNASNGGALTGTTEVQEMLNGVPQSGIALGKADAPVTLVEFVDPQCPFCKEFELNELPTLVEKYVRTGKVRIELRTLSFIGDDSVTGAKAINAAAAQGKAWNVADLIYFNQGKENSGFMTSDFLDKIYAAVPGLDAAKLKAAIGTSEVTGALGTANSAASRYAVSSTPGFVIGKTGGAMRKLSDSSGTAAAIGKEIDTLAGTSGT